ncbi:30S ribosomal protein S12 methylthiotransferase RimO [Chlorobaculum thiosulfatiphilum]|uniref:Ribosomal protein uS12 methylthiotransferase RimO n=1 Tax=Chlorobaculum thiosulfatiphilum TaxID=115852 RepID=A0A5C4S5I7_CHLTI|nr:30S ribosomal protein S12 methylthiotransferase RimO [Chlorobaculum thiosulfatiphilum]TNJ38773.1 30S ribosomal protein S12 methylthiotransferase RimO [Chlorobaculum thiosulfatiphilum]
MATSDGQKPAVFLLSLGCSKNTVDSERLTAQAVASGVIFTDDVDQASIILINTCGFIEDAKRESIDEMLAAIGKKEEGSVREVYVMGCLVELYRKELSDEMPEIDGWFGTRELPEVLAAIGARYREELFDRRELLTPPHYAFLKISEGCNRRCSFCSIPKIRGPYLSQPIEQLLREAALLQRQGVRELNLIAQDISVYGYDLYGKSALNDLTLRLSDMGFDWIRLLYAYPLNFPLEVISTMRERGNVCNYLDMPLQHIDDRILRSMQRGIGRSETIRLIDEIRSRNPEIRLRTTMIAGYPGETREEFDELLAFVRQTRFDRLGCFPYRHEEYAPAFILDDTVSDEEKESRVSELMELQEGISASLNRKLEGQTLKVLIDRIEENVAYARTEYDAPEVDNDVIIEIGDNVVEEGQFRQVIIEDSTAYELFGKLCDE